MKITKDESVAIDKSGVFSTDMQPYFIEFKKNGDILIKGKHIDNDMELVRAFRVLMKLDK